MGLSGTNLLFPHPGTGNRPVPGAGPTESVQRRRVSAATRRPPRSRPRRGRLTQPLDLRRGQPAVGAGREVAELERAEAHTLEGPHRMAHRGAHAPDLALAALVDRQFERV